MTLTNQMLTAALADYNQLTAQIDREHLAIAIVEAVPAVAECALEIVSGDRLNFCGECTKALAALIAEAGARP